MYHSQAKHKVYTCPEHGQARSIASLMREEESYCRTPLLVLFYSGHPVLFIKIFETVHSLDRGPLSEEAQ